ncbi:hypothetical protein [Pararhodonellum marinum]|nr:hypothetical protein [Pararhodonellum marinum]
MSGTSMPADDAGDFLFLTSDPFEVEFWVTGKEVDNHDDFYG